MKPVKLIPTCKDYIWGGTRLFEDYGIGDGGIAAEAWVLSARDDGPCFIAEGEYEGQTLKDVMEKEGKGIWGTDAERFGEFPLLIKLIDAEKDLSIQVHPSDDYALKNEGEYGKTEMWYVIDCREGAYLYVGFKEEITPGEFDERIKSNTITDVLNKVYVKKGDSIFIPSGTVHAICSGILLAEVQQNSNLTYRVYDYGRVGNDGQPRPLHVEKAARVAKLAPPEFGVESDTGENVRRIAQCEYFKSDVMCAEGELNVDEKSFAAVLCVDGFATVGELELKAGECAFIPAGSGRMSLSGGGKIIVSGV